MVESKSIQGVLIVIAITVMAAWLGVAVVTNQTETLLKVAGGTILAISLFLGRRIWLLLVFFMALNIPLLRGFNTTELGQGLFIGFSILLFLLRRLRLKTNFGELEVWMLIMVACILQAYLRNPVGLNVLGGSSVGARPYFVTALALLTGWILSVLVVPSNEIKWAMRLTILGTFVGLPISEVRTRAGLAALGTEVGEGRVAWLGATAQICLRWLVSKLSPFKALLNPLTLLVLLFGIAGSAASGYRNVVAASGLILVMGVYYHHGAAASVFSMVAAMLCIAMLAVVNVVSPLPGTMQRALSAFPGTWEERYVEDASSSTEWRVEMWKSALFTDHWIKNKLLGDGLGMTREELMRMQSLSAGGGDFARGTSGLTIQQENMMITGGYHSGPVQTVRTVGYVGLAFLLVAMVRVAVHMHRLILRARGTEWFPATLFLLAPNLVLPIQFTLVFGEFDAACKLLFFGIGLTRLMQNSLPIFHSAPVAARIEPSLGHRRKQPGLA
ncbi:hypothetical protein [Luteolibacter soli]|uniref:O-antigen ligase domain-containing protein n=1 Tax=Luteolibacter soli TaxID=3135280 RepID=A0ABU9AW13_9BACT